MTRRVPTADELAALPPIAETLETLIAGEAAEPDDKTFAVLIDRKVTEAIRQVFRAVGGHWSEPQIGMLRLILTKCDSPTERLYQGKGKRKKVLKELAEVPVDLRKLAGVQS